MYLSKPSFPISLTEKQAKESIKSGINSKGWNLYKILESKLIYQPYYLFNFHGFKKSEEDREEIQKQLALDALTGDFNESVSDLGSEESLSNETKKGAEFEVVNSLISEEEANELLPMKLSIKFDIPKENVFVTGLRGLYVPEWRLIVEVETKTYGFTVNAVTGKIDGAEKIPVKEKPWNEVIGETLVELQNPGAWVKYSSATFGSALSGAEKSTSRKHSAQTPEISHSVPSKTASLFNQLLTNTRLQIIFLGVIAIVVIVYFYIF